MQDAALRSLLRDLQGLRFAHEEKASDLEILIDYLEIVAVAAAEKPAHLQGQGMRSKSFMHAVRSVAEAHGLLVMHTGPLLPRLLRAPKYDPRFFEWERQRDREMRAKEGRVLWVYRERALERAIQTATEGETDVSEVLGYPACCVREYFEAGVRMSEAIVRAYETQYCAAGVDDFIRLAKENAAVTIAPADRPRIRHDFSYVQFSPCRACAESATSPAAEINWAMKRLASRLSPAFQRAIDKAVKAEVAARKNQRVVGGKGGIGIR
jgi:hypothetical protein